MESDDRNALLNALNLLRDELRRKDHAITAIDRQEILDLVDESRV
jgi:hypothetical protein